MKILIIHGGEIKCLGGVYKTVRETAKHLAEKGNDVFLLQENPFNLPDKECYFGFNVIRVKTRLGVYGFNPEVYFYLKKHFKELNPDIVHVHGYHTLFSIEAIYTIRKLDKNIPLVFSPHLDISRGTFAGKYLWNVYNKICKSELKKSSHIISVSQFEAQNIIKTFNLDSDKITIIPHGVNIIDPAKKTKQKTINLLYSGHLIDRKGVNFILNSLNSLTHELKVKNVTLTIIGEGHEKRKLLRMSKNLNLDKYIIWKSFLSSKDLITEIQNADIFILLSKSEAYGITVAESLALGTPCIVTKRTALKEFLNETGCFGVNYPPNPKEVAKLIIKIHETNPDVVPFSNKIRTWNMVIDDYEKVYQSLIN